MKTARLTVPRLVRIAVGLDKVYNQREVDAIAKSARNTARYEERKKGWLEGVDWAQNLERKKRSREAA